MNRIRIILTITISLLLASGSVFASEIKKIYAFDILVDCSEEMASAFETSNIKKISLAKKVLLQMNDRLPDLHAIAGLRLNNNTEKTSQIMLKPYVRSEMHKQLESIPENLSGDAFSIGEALDNMASKHSDMLRGGVIIVVTAGDSYAQEPASYEHARIFEIIQPGICVHYISVADSVEYHSRIERLAKLNDCSVVAHAADLLDNPEAMDEFVTQIFTPDVQKTDIQNIVPTTSEESQTDDSPETDFTLVEVNSLDTLFKFNSYKMDKHTLDTLNMIIEKLNAAPDIKLIIQGHTCNTGTAEYNIKLSMLRAEAIRDYMLNKGIAPKRLAVEALGEKEPKYDNSTPEGRRKNRRVEILTIKPNQ